MRSSLNYHSYGAGTPLIILHGLFGSGINWRSIAREFEEHHLVITPDARNHGDSPHSDEMSYPIMAEDIVRLARQNQWQDLTLVGHSMGGKTAMWIALQHPELVKKLVVVDIAPVKYQSNHPAIISAMQALDLQQCRSRLDADLQLAKHLSDATLRGFLLKNLVFTKGVPQWRFNLQGLANSAQTIMDFPNSQRELSYEGPTLFMGGDQSSYISRPHYKVIMQHFPNSHIVMIKKAGHWVHYDQKELFLKSLREFIL